MKPAGTRSDRIDYRPSAKHCINCPIPINCYPWTLRSNRMNGLPSFILQYTLPDYVGPVSLACHTSIVRIRQFAQNRIMLQKKQLQWFWEPATPWRREKSKTPFAPFAPRAITPKQIGPWAFVCLIISPWQHAIFSKNMDLSSYSLLTGTFIMVTARSICLKRTHLSFMPACTSIQPLVIRERVGRTSTAGVQGKGPL